MSFWNLFAKKKNKIVAIVDVASAAVGVALFSIPPQKGRGQAEIIAHAAEELPTDLALNHERQMNKICAAITRNLNSILTRGFRKPDEYVCFLSSAHAISQTRTLTYREETPRPLSKKTLSGILRRGEEGFYQAALSLNPEQLAIIESKILEIKLDGYSKHSPFGQPAREFKITQFVSAAPARILNKIEEAIIAAGHNDNISFHTYTLAAWSSLRDSATGDNDFIAIDVGGELTDILVSHGGILQENISFPFGLNQIKRALLREHKTTLFDLESQVALYLKNKLHPTLESRFAQALANVKGAWLTAFREALKTAAESNIIPGKIIISGDGGLGKIFQSWMSDESLHPFVLKHSTDKPHLLTQKSYADGRGGKNIQDPYLLMEAAYYEKMLNK